MIQFGMSLKMRDFKKFYVMQHGFGKCPRLYLSREQNHKFRKCLHDYFRRMVEIPRIRVGKRQTVETLINEEALLLAKFLRHERTTWKPRVAGL